MHELGAVLRTHHVDNDRRRVIAGWGIAIGSVAVVLALLLGGGTETTTTRQAIGLAIGVAIGAFWLALWHGWAAVRLAEERIVVHERGLVHSTARWDVIVPWDAVVHARVRFGQVRSPIAHYFGSQVWVRLTLRGSRRKVRFNGLIEGYDRLLETVLHHCVPAPGRSVRARWAFAGMAVVSVSVGLGLVAYVDTDPRISDTAIAVVAIGMVLCFLVAVVGIALAATRK